MPTVDERLNDTTPWTLADISRELDASPRFVAQWAHRSLMGMPESDRVLPRRAPGAEAPGRWLRQMSVLIVAAEGGGDGPCWPAGVILGWARRCARLDHNLNRIAARPTAPSRALQAAAARNAARRDAASPAPISPTLSAPAPPPRMGGPGWNPSDATSPGRTDSC